MDTITRAIAYRNEFDRKHPQYEEATLELLELMRDEIDDGGSPEHELDSFIQSVEQLID